MRRLAAIGALSAGALAAGLLTGCDSPGSPSDVVRVEVSGPATLAPGESASYALIEHLTGGKFRQVTGATWASSDPGVIQIGPTGQATAQSRTGEAVLSAKATLSASKEVVVLPANTYRLVGSVSDADLPSLPIQNARLEVVGGPTATSGANGSYRLYGVPSDGEIRVTSEGYQPLTHYVHLLQHGTQNFRLKVDNPKQYAGDYELTVEAAAGCSLPDELRRRTYAATVTQIGARLDVRLTEPRFALGRNGFGDRFHGDLTPTGATFHLGYSFAYYYAYYAAVRERLADGTTFIPHGVASTRGSPSGLTGRFDGWLMHATLADFPVILGQCQAASFSLLPR